MSSARIAPKPRSPRNASQARPRSWYGRSSPWKPSGVGSGASRRSACAGQQVAKPSVRVHRGQRHVVASAVDADENRLAGGHRAGPLALEELQRGLDLAIVEFHPLAADADERDLERGELGQFRGGQHLVADGQVVPELHQVREAERGLPADGEDAAERRPGGQLQPEPRLARPVRQEHAEPRAGQQRALVAQEPQRARGVQRDLGGRRLGQCLLERGEQPGRRAEARQEFLVRVGVTAQPADALPGPDIGRGQHQARILRGLERELDPPPGAGAVAALARLFRVFGLGRLHQAEAGADRAHREPGAGQPRS